MPGVNGRMGAAIADQVVQHQNLSLTVATARSDELIGTKVVNSDVAIDAELKPNFDVLIDFTLPEGVMQHLAYCLQHKKAMVIGATGCTPEQLQTIQDAAQTIPILMSSNMSVGVNICFKLLADAAKMFDANWNVSIVDVHHKHKKDSPSGTAKQMLQILNNNWPAKNKEIKVQSERKGEVVGSHAVSFTNPFEEIVIAHFAHNREIFAQGAVLAAQWILGKNPGLYSMMDVVIPEGT